MSSAQHSGDGSQLFLVRLWTDPDQRAETPGDPDQASGAEIALGSCHGRVQHVMSGKAASFKGWPDLMGLLLSMVPQDRQPTAFKLGEAKTSDVDIGGQEMSRSDEE